MTFRVTSGLSALALALVLAAPQVAQAQVRAGDKDISIQGTVHSAVGNEKNSFAELEIGFEYFQSRRLAWRIDIGTERTDDGHGAHVESTLGGGVEWNWGHPDSPNVPFIGLEVEHIFDGASSTSAIAPNIGLRAFVSRNTSFDVAGYYELSHDNGTWTAGLQLRLGFSFYFGRDDRR